MVMNGMRTTINKMTRPWRRQPLSASPHGRPLWAVAVLMCTMMLFAPQRAGAVVGSDLGDKAGFLYRFNTAAEAVLDTEIRIESVAAVE